LRTYQINIKPLTGFGTPLKGDTLFGQLCWQILYDKTLLGKDLDTLLSEYSTNPFCIISSAFPYTDGKIYLKKPSLPLHYLYDLSEDDLISKRKDLKNQKYFVYQPPLPPLNKIEYISPLDTILSEDEQVRCTINRFSGTTSRSGFAPFVVPKTWYMTELAIFVGVREDLPIEGVVEALRRIGSFGFGKDATAGWGKFEVVNYKEINFYSQIKNTENAYYTLSPVLPEEKVRYIQIFYEPFLRFGRHGDVLSSSANPFKAPVLLADEGAILIPENFEKKAYIGRAIFNVSSILEEAVTQGYSLVIPVEVNHGKI